MSHKRSKYQTKVSKRRKSKTRLLFALILILSCIYAVVRYNRPARVISLFGSLEDYLPAQSIDVNVINPGGNLNKVPRSDDPVALAISTTTHVVKEKVKKAKEDGEPFTSSELDQTYKVLNQNEAEFKKMTAKALDQAYKDLANAGAITPDQVPTTADKQDPGGQYQNNLELASTVSREAVRDMYRDDYFETYDQYLDQSFNVDTGVTCKTEQGAIVYGGETTLGAPAEGEAGKYQNYQVMSCTATGWQVWPGCIVNPGALNNCQVTILPSYFQETGHANCYDGDHLIGDNSIVGTKKCVNGEMVPVTSSVASESNNEPQQETANSEATVDSTPVSVVPPTDNAPVSPPPPTAIEDSQIDTRSECASSNGRWSELLGECVLVENSYISSQETIKKFSEENGDPESRRSCENLGGTYQPETDYCSLPSTIRSAITNRFDCSNPLLDRLAVGENGHSLSSNYVPPDLVTIKEIIPNVVVKNDIQINSSSIDALQELADFANANGYTLRVLSGYRSYEEQERIHEDNPEGSATPGNSQHQLGLAIDLELINNKTGERKAVNKSIIDKAETLGILHPIPVDPPHFIILNGTISEPSYNELYVDWSKSSAENSYTTLNNEFKQLSNTCSKTTNSL